MVLTISELIKKRKNLGVSQTELADVIGKFPSNISRIESGKLDCKVSTLEQIEGGLEIIKKNRHREQTGIIVLEVIDFKNTLYRSMIPEIDKREDEGEFAGNVKNLTETLVDLIIKEVCNNEDNR